MSNNLITAAQHALMALQIITSKYKTFDLPNGQTYVVIPLLNFFYEDDKVLKDLRQALETVKAA